MIILLTGEPQAGKSTIAQRFIERFAGRCEWVYMRIVADGDDHRAGFEAISSDGHTCLIAHKTAIHSSAVVGHNRFHVDTSVIDEFYTDPLTQALAKPPQCFVLDEIGSMQRLSPHFTPAVDAAFARNINLLATIRTRDDWTTAYINHPHAYPIAVTPETRDTLPSVLVDLFSNLDWLDRLTPTQRRLAQELTRHYCATGQPIQLGKLYQLALRYVVEQRLKPEDNGSFIAHGDHHDYRVQLVPEPTCECDLFTGRGQYAGQAGECSHLMATRLLQAV